MIFESIREFLGSQNFALTATNGTAICILKNQVYGRGIFCVLMDNVRSVPWSSSQIISINNQLKTLSSPELTGYNDVLFIVISADLERDKYLAGIDGVNVWLVENSSGKLIIYDSQSDDFYGLRPGIENAALSGAGYSDVGSRFTESSGKNLSAVRKNFPFVTASIIVVNVIVYIILAATGNPGSAEFMYLHGANFGQAVFKDFEIWRLVTSMFMHFSLSHLVSNMIYLAILGYQLENTLGKWKYLLIYFLSGIGASLVSSAYYYFKDQPTVSAGASGAIYGLIGVFVYLTILTARRQRSGQLFFRIAVGMIFIFYSSFMGVAVDGAAHVGGFIFGMILGILFIHPNERRKN